MSIKKPVGKFQMKHDFRLIDFSHEALCTLLQQCTSSHSAMGGDDKIWKEKFWFFFELNNAWYKSKLYRHSCVFSEWWWKDEVNHQVLKFLLNFSFHTCKWPVANISACSYDNPLQFQDALYHLRGKISFSRTGKGQSKHGSAAYWDQASPCRTSVHP